MRAALALASLTLLALAGAAAAHDAMVPLLLEERATAPPPAAQEPGQQPQSAFVAPNSGASFLAAFAGAAVVTLGTLWWVHRRPAQAA